MATTLEMLPDEIWSMILGHLSVPHIFKSLLDLNIRFQQLIIPYIRELDLTHVSLTEFHVFCRNLLPRFRQHIISLKLSNDYNFCQTNLFASYYPNLAQHFPWLEKLILVKCKDILSNGFLNSILTIQTLRELQLIDVYNQSSCRNTILSDSCQPHQLEKLVIISRNGKMLVNSDCKHIYKDPQRYTSLQHLNIDVQSFGDIHQLLDFLPSLRYFKANVRAMPWECGCGILHKPSEPTDEDLEITQPPPSLIYFHLGIYSISFDHLQRFLTHFRHSLEHLSFTMDKCESSRDFSDVMDGNRWEQLFTHTLNKVTQFNLFVKTSSVFFPFQKCLSTFSSPFWLDKEWFIDISQQMNDIYLNTRQFESYNDKNGMDAWQYVHAIYSNEPNVDQHHRDYSGKVMIFPEINDPDDLNVIQLLTRSFSIFSDMTSLEIKIIDDQNLCEKLDWSTIHLPHLTNLRFAGGTLFLLVKLFSISPRLQELRINYVSLCSVLSHSKSLLRVLDRLRLLHLTLCNSSPPDDLNYTTGFALIASQMPNLKHLVFTLKGSESQGQLDILFEALIKEKRFTQLSTVQFEWMRVFSSAEFRQNPVAWFVQRGLNEDRFHLRFENNIEHNNRNRSFNEFCEIETPDDGEELELWL